MSKPIRAYDLRNAESDDDNQGPEDQARPLPQPPAEASASLNTPAAVGGGGKSTNPKDQECRASVKDPAVLDGTSEDLTALECRVVPALTDLKSRPAVGDGLFSAPRRRSKVPAKSTSVSDRGGLRTSLDRSDSLQINSDLLRRAFNRAPAVGDGRSADLTDPKSRPAVGDGMFSAPRAISKIPAKSPPQIQKSTLNSVSDQGGHRIPRKRSHSPQTQTPKDNNSGLLPKTLIPKPASHIFPRSHLAKDVAVFDRHGVPAMCLPSGMDPAGLGFKQIPFAYSYSLRHWEAPGPEVNPDPPELELETNHLKHTVVKPGGIRIQLITFPILPILPPRQTSPQTPPNVVVRPNPPSQIDPSMDHPVFDRPGLPALCLPSGTDPAELGYESIPFAYSHSQYHWAPEATIPPEIPDPEIPDPPVVPD